MELCVWLYYWLRWVFVNGFFLGFLVYVGGYDLVWCFFFFFLTWFCFWFDGPMVVLGYIGGGNVFTVLL